MSEQKPTVGRIVNVQIEGETIAAMIVATNPIISRGSNSVIANYFMPFQPMDCATFPYSEKPREWHWSWPPRV